ncbi:MAG: type II toxin-antitoxin system HicB family antitoxin [archaeon]
MKIKFDIKKGEKFWVARIPELGVITQGATEKEAKENLKEALEIHLESMANYAIEHGELEVVGGRIMPKKYA